MSIPFHPLRFAPPPSPSAWSPVSILAAIFALAVRRENGREGPITAQDFLGWRTFRCDCRSRVVCNLTLKFLSFKL
jgi:hypothetical protein